MIPEELKKIEICRSYSFRANLGNYQSADVFCSAKKEATDEEAGKVADDLYQFCRNKVDKDIKELKKVFKSDVTQAEQNILNNPEPLVEEWENMPPVEQALRQQLKLASNRIKYKQNVK